ncbi:MAG: YfcE family phosphodiesterase [Candidatus Omnitrophota bacterium]
MRILVIADTHIPVTAKQLPRIVIEEAKQCDCCIHAGDIISIAAFNALSQLTKTYAVLGNMDNVELQGKLAYKTILAFDSIRLGLIHGRGTPSGLIEYIKKEFAAEMKSIDMFIFGHTHYPFNKEIDGKIYFNPGSPTDKIFAPYCSYGIVEIQGKTVTRSIVEIPLKDSDK